MWPGITYETCRWERDPDELAFRRKILSTYEAAVPARIAALPVEIPASLSQRLAEVEVSLARFDQAQAARTWSLPALLLRSESSTSSTPSAPFTTRSWGARTRRWAYVKSKSG